MTASPGPFSTGRLSPVSMLSSSAERPSMIDAVDRHLLARADADQIADDDRLDRDVLLDAVADDAGGLGLQAHQRLDRRAGLLLGARLEPAAQQDQGDDDDRRSRSRGGTAKPQRAASAGQSVTKAL